MSDRDFALHYARVLLTEARRRRGQAFAWTLLAWAHNAIQEARKGQVELFGRVRNV